MNHLHNPIIIEFPLRGEWQAPTTPAKQIPSHGTNRLGLRYAFDFLQIHWESKNKPFYQISSFRRFLLGVPLNKCFCWGQAIYAPCDGEVVAVIDGIPERKVAHWLVDSIIALKNAATFNENKNPYSQIAGNYIVMKHSNNVYLAFAHLQTGSVHVSVNDKVKRGELLGRIGHSGNSTSPHLHFQMMDSADFAHTKGLPFLFEKYEVYRNNTWKTVYHQIPSDQDRIRFYKSNPSK